MDTTFFNLKRAHHETLAWARKLLAPFGITPARYDLLRTIYEHDDVGCMEQQRLLRILGVSAPTVSRMLKSLVQLGLVEHYRVEECARLKVVELTADAMRLLARIERALYEWQLPALLAHLSLNPFSAKMPGPRVTLLLSLLTSVRTFFSDRERLDPYDEETLVNMT
jgi:DNA-binding MarR family transcriptional regulator